MAQFSLSWDAYKSNICAGLSALQQNGEFVDMTLAADGHHVKVHQLVMSLASPYIKEIITSTQCQHPVIFLNKISYATLCAILEYIYTGEVVVAKENLDELVAAGKELHIKGLTDMNVDITPKSDIAESQIAGHNKGHQLSISSYDDDPNQSIQTGVTKVKIKTGEQITQKYETQQDDTNYLSDNMDNDADNVMDIPDKPTPGNVTSLPDGKNETRVQYTLSNQGSLQMILNRYLYRIGYTSTRDRRLKRWECTDNRSTHCHAVVYTKDEVVIKRQAAHNHPFHDKRILKKIRDKSIFSAISEAEVAKLKMQESKSNENV